MSDEKAWRTYRSKVFRYDILVLQNCNYYLKKQIISAIMQYIFTLYIK